MSILKNKNKEQQKYLDTMKINKKQKYLNSKNNKITKIKCRENLYRNKYIKC